MEYTTLDRVFMDEDIDALATQFIESKPSEKLARIPEGPKKDQALQDLNRMLTYMKTRVTQNILKELLETEIGKLNGSAARAAGGRRMTRKYCKKTACRKMGFSQKASCRRWKNCYSTRRRGVST